MLNPSTLLVVLDLKVAKQFYIEVLGLTLVSETTRCLKLSAGNHEVLIFQGTLAAIDYQHDYNASSTLVFTVNQLDTKIEQLKHKGVEFIHQSPNQNDWGRYAAFKDPSGIVHELFEAFY